MRVDRAELLTLAVILLFALTVRLALIDRPFHRDEEGCGSFFGMLARNYWRYDARETLGLPVMSMGLVERPTIYANHPPLVPLLIAGVFGLAGYTGYADEFPPDWLVRLPTAPFTLGCTLMVWWLLRRSTTQRAALAAAAIFASMPITLVFGGMPDVISPQLVFFILLSVLAYLRLHERATPARLVMLCLAFLLAALTDWPAFYMVPVFAVHFAATRPLREWRWIAAFGLISILFFAAAYAHIAVATRDLNWMAHLLHRRAISGATDADAAFTFTGWFNQALVRHGIVRHTWPVVLLSLAWMVWALARWNRPTPGAAATGLLLVWAILHIAVGRQGVLMHAWWWWPLTSGLAMAAGLMLDRLGQMYELPCRGLIDLRPVYSALVLVAALVGFAGWNTRAAFIELSRPATMIGDPRLDYTVDELGQIIRNSTPPNAVVMLTEADQSLGLWYYADRPIRYQVWDPLAFERRLDDGTSDLCFGLTESHRGRAAVLIVPKAYVEMVDLTALVEHVTARYPAFDAGKFLVFDLSGAK